MGKNKKGKKNKNTNDVVLKAEELLNTAAIDFPSLSNQNSLNTFEGNDDIAVEAEPLLNTASIDFPSFTQEREDTKDDVTIEAEELLNTAAIDFPSFTQEKDGSNEEVTLEAEELLNTAAIDFPSFTQEKDESNEDIAIEAEELLNTAAIDFPSFTQEKDDIKKEEVKIEAEPILNTASFDFPSINDNILEGNTMSIKDVPIDITEAFNTMDIDSRQIDLAEEENKELSNTNVDINNNSMLKVQDEEVLVEDENFKYDRSNAVPNDRKKYVKDSNNFYFSYNKRVFVFGTSLIVCCILLIVLLFNCVSFQKRDSFKYKEIGGISYKVALKNNDYYEEDFLNSNMIYVASLIKQVQIDYDFYINVDDKIKNGELMYGVFADLVIKDSTSDKVYFTKRYDVESNIREEVNDVSEYSIDKHVDIDYDYYNELASKFRGEYGVDADCFLRVLFIINSNNSNIKLDKGEMYVDIPLSQRAISISSIPMGTSEYSIDLDETQKTYEFDSFYLLPICIVVVLMLFFMIKLIGLLNKTNTKKTVYQKTVSKILREYDRLIVEISQIPDFKNKNVIKVTQFKELLDVRDNLKLPIIYSEVNKNEKSYFYISKDTDIYLYILKRVDLEK